MNLSPSSLAGLLLAALAVAGCLYQIAAILLLQRFLSRQPTRSIGSEGITLLKPLHGSEPRLRENLASFLAQDYAGPRQMVCGVTSDSDPAMAQVAELQRDHPDCDIDLVVAPRPRCANGKIGNLINMASHARHGLLALSDSDIAVSPDYLSVVAGMLEQPGVGAVTCLYRGRADAGFWSRLSAGSISYSAMPQIIVGHVTRIARPCMGSTIAMQRETLQAIGGFQPFADVLADDYAIGEAIAKTGKRIAVPPLLLVHGCDETSLSALWRQKLRWSATIRGVATIRHTGSIVTYPLPLALLAAVFLPAIGLLLALASLALRLALAATVDARAREGSAPLWYLPVIDCIDFGAFLASFVAQTIEWRGSRLTMQHDGRIAARKRPL